MSGYNDRSVSQALSVTLLIRMYYNLLSNLCVIAPLGKFWIFTAMHDVATKLCLRLLLTGVQAFS